MVVLHFINERISLNSELTKSSGCFSVPLLWESWMHCRVFSNRELTSEIRPGCGVWALWCCARGWAMCAVQGREGGCRGQELTPRHTGSPSSGILMAAGQESLRQRKLSQATSCYRLARISFMAWLGPQIWKPQHYEAAYGKAFLAVLSLSSSYPGWNEIENTLSAVRDLKLRGASQAQNGRSVPWTLLWSNQASITYMAIM